MTDFLYPFIDSAESDPGSLLADLGRSARAKVEESETLTRETLTRVGAAIRLAGAAMAERFGAGGRALCFGNGGSSTDAEAMAALLGRPEPGPPLPGWSLSAATSVVTAVANDVGFELAYARQIVAFGRACDIAVGFSTSGNSPNLVAAFAEARRLGMLTVGFAGYDGGQMARCGLVTHCLVVESQSVHRIQETQAALSLALWQQVRADLDRPAGPFPPGPPPP